jgi:hypothetical protein
MSSSEGLTVTGEYFTIAKVEEMDIRADDVVVDDADQYIAIRV